MKEKDNFNPILLNIGFAIHNADWNYKDVYSPFARIYLINEGTAKLHLLNNYVQELTPEHLYLIPPFTKHSYECDSYFTLYYIHLYETPTLSDYRILEDYFFPVEVKANEIDLFLVQRLLEINPERGLKLYDPKTYDNSSNLMHNINTHSKSTEYVLMTTKGILLYLLAYFFKDAMNKYESTDNRIRKVLKYIRKNIDKVINLEELIQMSYLSKDHFIRIFKKEIGTTPVKYINLKKIEKAQLLLATGEKSIKDIAYELSFENVYYFNRLFKKSTGLTPIEYRKRK